MSARRGQVHRISIAMLVLTLLAGASGCSDRLGGTPLPNQRPVVRLTQAPANPAGRYFYAYTFEWFGHDPDGQVDHFIYAVDPPPHAGADTAWVRTAVYRATVQFRSEEPDPSGAAGQAVGHHTFVIKAVDNRGAVSEPEIRSFFSTTVAPSVYITSPRPSALATALLAPSIRITWTGSDLDGIASKMPVAYKYKLLTPSGEFPLPVALADPDSLRRFYAPQFTGWDSTDAENRSVQLTNLTPGAEYIFVVVAFDEAGAYSPIFSLESNMLRFRATFASAAGPRITFFSTFFNFTYPSGGYSLDPSREVNVDLLPGQDMLVNWYATPGAGTDLRSYRWRLNGDVGDETQRANDQDIGHWSFPSLHETFARLGPFAAGETHRLYVEVEDNTSNRSLGIIKFNVLGTDVTFSKPLLIVDDTRLAADEMGVGGCVRTPVGVWPTAAELDTFLYARGGVPWRCYPAGTTSEAGLFHGYAFDTLGTRPGGFSFVKLAEYAHVIWILDARSALLGGSIFGGDNDITSLRYMTVAGRINTLGAYLEQGGKLWLVGGGGGYAATINRNVRSNDRPSVTFSSALGELAPGVFMYDFMGWRSEFLAATSPLWLVRSPRAVGEWAGAPPYALLPPRIDPKTAATDPFPPGRAGQSPSVFYKTVQEIEYLSKPTRIIEDVDLDPDVFRAESTLDTLYSAVGFALPGPAVNDNVVMTLYHGPFYQPAIFSGFDLWSYRRAQLGELVDFVLQQVWSLPRNAPRAAAP